MNYCRYDYIRSDSSDIPDATVFVVYRKSDETWAFALRINGVFTLTKFHPQDAHEQTVLKAKKQISFCKNYGWSYMGRKAWNTEVDDMEHEFMCLYCRNITFDTSDPCPCRNKTKFDFLKKTPSGIVLPF